MHPKTLTLLEGMLRSCDYITEDALGVSLEAWLGNRTKRQAVERNLEIIGEGLGRLKALDPEVVSRISHVPQIIGLRNRLAHGYHEEIDDTAIWQVVQTSIPILTTEIESLINPST